MNKPTPLPKSRGLPRQARGASPAVSSPAPEVPLALRKGCSKNRQRTLSKGRLAKVRDWEKRARAANFQARALADQCAVSLRHLERYFRLTLRVSPQEWLDT